MSRNSKDVISTTRLAPRIALPVVAIMGLSLLPVLWISVSGETLFGIITAALLVVITLAVALMRVTITVDDDGVHGRCLGIFRMHFRWGEITAVEEGDSTGVLAGAGYRILADGSVGLLVGGPTVRLHTSRRHYLLSASEPQAVISRIRSSLGTHRGDLIPE